MYEFCEAILEISHEFILFPTNSRETAIAIQKFRTFTESKIPQVVGVNDGTHIEILCVDSESRVDYFSRKQRYTINTQAAVPANLVSAYSNRISRLFTQPTYTQIVQSLYKS